MNKMFRNPVVLSSLAAILLVVFGLFMPGRVGVALSAYVATNTPVPTVQPDTPPSEDEARERARGIYRTTFANSVVFTHKPGDGNGGMSLSYLVNGSWVSLPFFGGDLVTAAATTPQTLTATNPPVAGWRVVIGPSTKGSLYRHIQVFNASNVLVLDIDAKIP